MQQLSKPVGPLPKKIQKIVLDQTLVDTGFRKRGKAKGVLNDFIQNFADHSSLLTVGYLLLIVRTIIRLI